VEVIVARNIAWAALEAKQADLLLQVEKDPSQRFLLLSEPQPTFTHGLSSSRTELLWENPEQKGVSLHPVSRGGKWTYHGPGQLVAFPIMDLSQNGFGKRQARPFLERVSRIARDFIASYGIETELRPQPYGLYYQAAKVASFGFSLQKGVSSHGFAIYLTKQTPYFEGIVPCGAQSAQVTSLEEAGVHLEWESAAARLGEFVESGFQEAKN
jgi:lipoyl(octanoyl) transferase